jgi:type I site-specific restriction endonuclease
MQHQQKSAVNKSKKSKIHHQSKQNRHSSLKQTRKQKHTSLSSTNPITTASLQQITSVIVDDQHDQQLYTNQKSNFSIKSSALKTFWICSLQTFVGVAL